MRDTEMQRTLRREAETTSFQPDLDDLRLRLARKHRRRRLGVLLMGLSLSAASIAAAVALVGPLATPDRPQPAAVDQPEGVIPEGSLWVQEGSHVEILRTGSNEASPVAAVTGYDVSPDGSLLLAKDDRRLVVVYATGDMETLFTPEDGDELQAFAEWSPDGTMVAYSVGSQDPADRSTLCVLTLASGEQACYPDAGNVYTFDWAPDGNSVVVAGPPSRPISRVDLVTGEVSAVVAQEGDTPINRELEAQGWGRSFQLVDPMWSPSGRYLAALANMDTGPYAYVPVVFTPLGEPITFGRPSTEFPEPFAWSPVEDVLAYSHGEAPYRITDLYLLDPATESDSPLVSSGEDEYPQITDLAWSPSGRWLALTLWWAPAGYPIEAVRIVDAVTSEQVTEFESDTGEITAPLIDWGP